MAVASIFLKWYSYHLAWQKKPAIFLIKIGYLLVLKPSNISIKNWELFVEILSKQFDWLNQYKY